MKAFYNFIFAMVLSLLAGPNSASSHDSILYRTIVGGSDVSPDDPIAKSTVGIYFLGFEGSGRINHFCGGTIIGKRKVITAAHCFVDRAKRKGYTPEEFRKNSRVAFGLDYVVTPDAESVKFAPICRVDVHPEYISGQAGNAKGRRIPDLAILTLCNDIPKGYKAAEIVKTQSSVREYLQIVTAGWGAVDGRTDRDPTVLQKVGLVVSDPYFSPSHFSYRVEGGRSFCGGDSGGPAYLSDGSKLSLIGVVSMGDDNCEEMGAFTSVPIFASWISSLL